MSDEQYVDPSAVPPEEAPEEPAPEPEAQEAHFDPQAAYGQLAGQVDEIRGYLASLSQGGQEEYAPPQYQPQGEEFDPFDPNSFESAVGSAVEQRIAPLVQALQPIVEQHRDAESKQFVDQQYEIMGVPESDRDEVLIMSAGYRMAGQSPVQAMNSAWQALQARDGRAKGAGAQEQRQELEQIVAAPGVPQGSQPGSVPAESRPASMEDAAKRIAAKLGIGN